MNTYTPNKESPYTKPAIRCPTDIGRGRGETGKKPSRTSLSHVFFSRALPRETEDKDAEEERRGRSHGRSESSSRGWSLDGWWMITIVLLGYRRDMVVLS